MANTIGAKIVLDGEAEYRKALKNITSEQKELRSEMKLATSEFSGQQNTVDALTKKQEILAKQYDVQARKVETYTKAVEESSRKQDEAGDKVSELREALDKAQQKMSEMSDSADASSESLEAQQKAVNDLSNKLLLAQDDYDKTKRATNDWQTSLNNAQGELSNLSRQIEDNNRYLRDAESNTDGCTDALDEYGKEVDTAKDKTSVFGDVLKAELCSEAIIQGVKAIAEGIATMSKSVVSVGSSFESGMSQVAATMGMTAAEIQAGSEEFEILKNAAEESGKATKYSATQSAEALNYLALAGYDAQKSAETLPKVLNLAAAGGMELAYSSDLVTDAMSALGMETEDLDKYIDQMAKTSQKSNTSVAQLGEATLVCAGTVSLTQQPLETMNAELGILANNGIKGAEGGTHLRNVLLSLISPTDKGAIALKNLGVNVSDNDGKMRDLNDIMVDLNSSLSNLSEESKTQTISAIFNKTDITAVNSLLYGTNGQFEALREQLNNCDGAAAAMAETMEANLAGKVTILESALEGLGITAYDKVEGTLKHAVDAATESVGELQDSMDNGRLGESMDDFADALGDAADGAIEFATDALPAVIDGLTWVMDNSELVIAGIGGITAATVTHGAVVPLITATMKAWDAYKKSVEGATVAQMLFESVKSATGIGLITTALVGAVAAFAIYKNIVGDTKNETQEIIESIHEEQQGLQDNATARKDSAAAQKTEIDTITRLKNELAQLNEKEVLSNEEKTRMKLIVDELNEAMPDLNLEIEEQSEHLNMTNETLDTYVESMQKALEIGFMEEELTEIARDHYEAQKSLTEAETQYQELQQKSIEVQEGWAKACEEGDEAMRLFNESLGVHAIEAIASYDQQMKDLQPTLEEAKQLEQDLQLEYDNMAGKLAESQTAMESAQEATSNLTTVTEEYKGKVYEVSSGVSERIGILRDAYSEAYQSAAESIEGQISLFQQLSLESDLSVQDMATNLESQANVLTQYKDDLLTAADLAKQGLLDEGLLGAIQELGIDGAGYLHELVESAQGDTEALSEVMTQWAEMQEAQATLIETMADISSGYSEGMEEILGIQEETNETSIQKTKDTSKEILEETEKALDELVTNTGDSLNDMTDAVNKKAPEVKKASVELINASIQGANETLGINEEGVSTSFVSIGYSIPQGIAEGITMGQDIVRGALQNAIDYAISAIDLSGITAQINRELGGLLE